MAEKAKFVAVIRNRNPYDKKAWEHTELLYEYRGHEYIVTKHNNGYSGDSLPSQHKKAQEEIDKLIDAPKQIEPWKYEGSAQEGFDLFWKYVES